jgi:hypothetical protein
MIIVRLLSPEPFLVGWHHQSLLGSREPTLSWNQFHSKPLLSKTLCQERIAD